MLLRLPLLEGRAKDLDLFSIYADPFIWYGYITAIPFFMALYAGVLYIESLKENAKYAIQSKHYLNKIKNAAFSFALMLLASGLYIKFFHHPNDDPAGFIAITMLCTVAAISLGLWARGKGEINHPHSTFINLIFCNCSPCKSSKYIPAR
jgi:hypothetical protein